MIDTIIPILGLFVSFLAGWIVATDKNRNEAYKRKIDAYQELITQLSQTIAKYLRSHLSDEAYNEFIEECINLSKVYISNSLFISIKVKNHLEALYSHKDWDDKIASQKFNAIHAQIKKELQLGQADWINEKLLFLATDISVKKQETKTKTKEKC